MPSTQARAVGERAEASATARPPLAPALVVALAAIVILLARSRHYLPFMVDDAFISLRCAERLVAGNGLTWTDGERVEGYTNLLWVLCTAALHALGVDLVVAARLLGLLGMTATLLAPDLVIFCGPAGHDTPCYVSGWEMTAKPGFHRDYTPVVFEGHDPHLFRTFVWARKEYGRIGVERSAARVVVPGFLVGVGTGVVARLDAGGRLVAALPPGGMAIYRGLTLSPGRWNGHVEGTGAPVTLRVHSALTGKVLAEGERPAFVADHPMAVDLEVSAADGAPTEIARLAFARD